MTARDEARELRATIAAITGRPPRAGCSLAYLRRRMTMLRDDATLARERRVGSVAGHLVGTFVADVGTKRIDILMMMATSTSLPPSAVVARAIDELAVRLGLGAEVERAKRRG